MNDHENILKMFFQIFIGIIFQTNLLSHLMNKNDPTTCLSCGTGFTIKHIITECRSFSETRSITKLPERLAESFGYNRSSLEATIEFIRKAKLRNKIKKKIDEFYTNMYQLNTSLIIISRCHRG